MLVTLWFVFSMDGSLDYFDMLMVCYTLLMNMLFELSCLSLTVLECGKC